MLSFPSGGDGIDFILVAVRVLFVPFPILCHEMLWYVEPGLEGVIGCS